MKETIHLLLLFRFQCLSQRTREWDLVLVCHCWSFLFIGNCFVCWYFCNIYFVKKKSLFVGNYCNKVWHKFNKKNEISIQILISRASWNHVIEWGFALQRVYDAMRRKGSRLRPKNTNKCLVFREWVEMVERSKDESYLPLLSCELSVPANIKHSDEKIFLCKFCETFGS